MFNQASAVHEWMPSELEHNFGDHLMQLIGQRLYQKESWTKICADVHHKYVLLGSFICDGTIRQVLDEQRTPVLVGCGYRGELITPAIGAQTVFLGVRGYDTQWALRKSNIETSVIGDPAMLLPLLVKRPLRRRKRALLVPHINDPRRLDLSATDVGCDEVVQPGTKDLVELVQMVRKIASSSFVLAGAMHAAVVAHAFGIPFAFYGETGGYVDCPPKWRDWLSSISRPCIEPKFHAHINEGREWYSSEATHFWPIRYAPVLSAYSAIGRLKRRICLKAVCLDAVSSLRDLLAQKSTPSPGQLSAFRLSATSQRKPENDFL